MIEKNILLLFAITIFISLSIKIALNLNFLETLVYTSFFLLPSFFFFFYFSSKNGIYFKLETWNLGLLISILFSFLKFPVFPFIYFNAYYKKFERVLKNKLTEKEISLYISFFIFILFSLGLLSITFLNFKFSLVAFSFIFSIMLPYKNSPGNNLFLINPLVYGIILALSFSLYLLSYYVLIFL
ncbi:MAG: hypothetical protein QXQ14_01440 [Candidatus Aenigmatarchaeota archaeon]